MAIKSGNEERTTRAAAYHYVVTLDLEIWDRKSESWPVENDSTTIIGQHLADVGIKVSRLLLQGNAAVMTDCGQEITNTRTQKSNQK